MALFGRKEKGSAKRPVAQAKPAVFAESGAQRTAHVLKSPRITEKATMHQDSSVYTFDIDESATKRDVIAAVRAVYKVTPKKVAIVTIPRKIRRSVRTGKRGVARGGKKAYVYLTEGETITLG